MANLDLKIQSQHASSWSIDYIVCNNIHGPLPVQYPSHVCMFVERAAVICREKVSGDAERSGVGKERGGSRLSTFVDRCARYRVDVSNVTVEGLVTEHLSVGEAPSWSGLSTTGSLKARSVGRTSPIHLSGSTGLGTWSSEMSRSSIPSQFVSLFLLFLVFRRHGLSSSGHGPWMLCTLSGNQGLISPREQTRTAEGAGQP